MNDRHKQIIEYWNGGKWGGGHSFQETGDKFGVTRQRIQTIVKQHGLQKMGKPPKPPKPARIPKHGTRNEYGYWECRCDLCKQSNANHIKLFLNKKRIKGENEYDCKTD
jgi:hypothetical protein